MSAGYSPNPVTLISGPTAPLPVARCFPLAFMATLVIDGTIVLAYASATGFRYYHWLMYAHLVNLFTQPLLWCLTGLLPAVVA